MTPNEFLAALENEITEQISRLPNHNNFITSIIYQDPLIINIAYYRTINLEIIDNTITTATSTYSQPTEKKANADLTITDKYLNLMILHYSKYPHNIPRPIRENYLLADPNFNITKFITSLLNYIISPTGTFCI